MQSEVVTQFEAELAKRGLSFSVDGDSGRHAIEKDGAVVMASLENIARQYQADGNPAHIVAFVEHIEQTLTRLDEDSVFTPEGLFWFLEPNDYEDAPDITEPLSRRVDRVLCHLAPDGSAIAWVSPLMLTDMGLSREEANSRALQNLAAIADKAEVEISRIDEVDLAMLSTSFPAKSALLLAPNLKQVLEPRLGWPLLAVAPDRDFVYLWDARHTEFAGRLGGVVVEEFHKSPYPLSVEVYEISDAGVRAIGAFAAPPENN